MNIPNTNQILFGVRRSDGQRKAFYGSVNSDGTANIKLPSWLLEIVGKHTCDVGVLNDDGLLLSTMPFMVEVVEAPCTDDVIVEEEDPSLIATITQLAKAYPALLNRIDTLENQVGDFDAVTDYAKATVGGVVKVVNNERGEGAQGIKILSTGEIVISMATEEDILNRSTRYRPITPMNLDYAVKTAMCDDKGAAWTEAEQLMARNRLGITAIIGDIESALARLIEAQESIVGGDSV